MCIRDSLGIEGTGWGGPRVRPEVPNVISARDEERYLFWTEGLSNDLSNIGDWEMPGGSGYMSMKFTYTNENDYYNTSGAIKMNTFNNADFPLFRLADTFLMLAECQLNGVQCDGLTRLNEVRARAGMEPVAALSEDVILKERMCELYGEGTRRSDLIRFGKFSTGRWWDKNPDADSHYELFPLALQVLNTNSNLKQNPGY